MNVKEIERSLLTKYRKEIYRPFTKAVDNYHLINDDDHICVCISGGKDSLIMAKCMQQIERYGKAKIKCEYVVMDPGFKDDVIKKIQNNAEELGIEIKIFKTDIFTAVKNANHKSPCYICAKMRRGWLYSIAKDLGCNKIALGHHFDDVIETTILSMFYSGIFNTMLPIVDSENFEGMQLIRPMYLVREESILRFIKKWNIVCDKNPCPLNIEDSKRAEVKQIIKKLKETNEFIDLNIFKSTENVVLEHVRGVIKDKKHYDRYNDFDKFI